MGVEAVKEATCLFVLADLGELVGDGAGTQRGACQLVRSGLDGSEDGVIVFSGRLTVGDGDDEDGDLHLALPCARQHKRLQDLATKLGADGRAAPEVDRLDKPVDVGLVADVVALRVAVDEADSNPVRIEQGSGSSSPAEDTHHIPDTLASLWQHGSAVVDVDDNVEEGETYYVLADLERDLPRPAQRLDLWAGDTGDVGDVRGVTEGRHVLEVLLPDALLQALTVEVLVGLHASSRRSRWRALGLVRLEAAGWRRVRLLLLLLLRPACTSNWVGRISLEVVCQLSLTGSHRE
ncbi:MAG: hypothetical protein Q8869_00270 [Candidatus Phytoplasma australasiaticum]|nr:hypothetical protein [Candidatus Phytoplasma australasiaticum]